MQKSDNPQQGNVLQIDSALTPPQESNLDQIVIASTPVEEGIEALDTMVRLIKKNTAPADPVDESS